MIRRILALLFLATSAFGQFPNLMGPVPLVQTVDTIATLLARQPVTNILIGVRGYSTIGDWGDAVDVRWVRYDPTSAAATNANCVFATTNGVGRWIFEDCLTAGRLVGRGSASDGWPEPITPSAYIGLNGTTLYVATNTAVLSGILPPYTEGALWLNGEWKLLTDIFAAGTNVTISGTTSNITINTSGSGTGSSTVYVNGTATTNVNFIDDAYVKLAVDGTNVTAYLTNWLSWEGIPFAGGSRPNLKDGSYTYWVNSGSNIVVEIRENVIGFDRLEQHTAQTLVGVPSGSATNLQEITIGANLSLDTNGVLSAVVSSSTNGTPVSVNGGGVLAEANLADNSEVAFSSSGSNVTATLVANSIATNKLDTTFLSLLLNQYRINNSTNTFLGITNSATVTWATNGNGDWEATSSATGGGGLGTNAFVNGVLLQPVYFTNSAEVFWSTNGNGHVVLSINQWDGFWSDLTNAIVASNNVAIAYDTGNNKLLLSATVSGSTNGTPITVDGGSVLTAANFQDASTTGLFDISGTNITIRLPDRDFGDITVGSSGAGMTINANSVALGTDTTGNFIATVAGTSNEIDASGSGSESAAVTLSLSSTIDLGGKTSFELPNGASPTTDAFGEIAADNDAWAASRGAVQFFDGTANTRLIGALASDTPSNGQVPKWNTGGTITWEDDNTGGGGGGSGTNFFLNGVLIQPAYITNSSTLVWATNANGDVYGTVTNVSGTTTDNVLQRIGYAIFKTTADDITETNYSGVITDLTHNSGDSMNRMVMSVALTGVSDTNYVALVEVFDTNSPGTPAVWDVLDKTTSGFQINSSVFDGSAQPNGYWYRVWILDTVSVGGSGGDVISTANNNFSGTNNFAGPINAATLTVNDDAYGSGWDGSTNVPTKNAIYDKIESLSAGSNTEWDSWDQWETRSWSFNGNTISLALEPTLTSAAISSGVVSGTTARPEFDGRTAVLFRTATGASTSTGGFIFDNLFSKFLTERANQFKADFVLNRTNGAVYALGYGDSTTTTEPTDALRLSITNDMVYGVAISNTVKAVTATGFQLLQGVSYSGWILQTNNYASFIIKSNVFGESAVTVWSDVLTNGLPISSARSLGLLCGGWNTATANTNGVDLLYIDTIIDRKQK